MSEDIESPTSPDVASHHYVSMALIALGALATGVLVYALDRAPDSAYFLPASLALFDGAHVWFGPIGGQLPEFVHVYAFALLTAVVFASSRRAASLSCTAWWAIDSLFELGQHPTISPVIAGVVPAWLEGVPFLENAGPFFTSGTFDRLDLVAIAAGAIAAYCTIVMIHIRHEDSRHVECS